MGVRGLRTYLIQNNFLANISFQNTTVIIDGMNICNSLFDHRHNDKFPCADYNAFARRCRLFFKALQKNGIRAYVVFDGGSERNGRKLRTRLQRKQNVINDVKEGRYGKLPAFGVDIFIEVLDELEIPRACTAFDADVEIAVLAKKWNCPIMSNDSDFFVFQLEAGCILMPDLYYAEPVTENSINVKFFQYEYFLKEKNILQNRIPIMAAIMGNDYMERSTLLRFYREKRWYDHAQRPNDILSWIKTFGNSPNITDRVINDAFGDVDQSTNDVNALKAAIDDYHVNEFSTFDLDMFFKKNTFNQVHFNDYYGNRLPDWFTEGLLCCSIQSSFLQDAFLLHRVVFTCQWEDLELPSATFCSRYIRQVVYGIAVASAGEGNIDIHFVEHDRDGDRCWPFVVVPIREVKGFGMLPDIHTITDMSVEVRQRLFLACFGIKPAHMENIEMTDAVVSVILCMSFWLKHAEPNVGEKHVDALLVGVIYLHMKSMVCEDKCKNMCASIRKACIDMGESALANIERDLFKKYDHRPYGDWDSNIMHAFAQFHTCYKDILRLNKVLRNPFKSASAVVLLNNNFAYNLFLDLHLNGVRVENVLGNQRSHFQLLFASLKKKIMRLSKAV
ncbi:Protein asteroid 1 [Mactra antiquata]